MNRERRKTLIEIKERIEEHRMSLDEISTEIDDCRDAEEEAYDNMPESLQESERGDTMQDNIDTLAEIVQSIEYVSSLLEDAVSYIEELAE